MIFLALVLLNDHWHRIEVCIYLGIIAQTRFQTNGPKMQKLVFHFFLYWRVYFSTDFDVREITVFDIYGKKGA